jgi:hypothetical protein
VLGGRGSSTGSLSIAGCREFCSHSNNGFASVLWLKYILLTILLACSFADLQNPQMDFDGKACAAVGQSGLMAIYDMLFSQVSLLDLTNLYLVIKEVLS